MFTRRNIWNLLNIYTYTVHIDIPYYGRCQIYAGCMYIYVCVIYIYICVIYRRQRVCVYNIGSPRTVPSFYRSTGTMIAGVYLADVNVAHEDGFESDHRVAPKSDG